MKYNVLVLGSGGREHALCWKLSKSTLLGKLYCIPGNTGISDIAETFNEPDILNFSAIEDFCKSHDIHLIAVGKELPLVYGIKDYFKDSDILVFGPSKKAAQLEGSKIYTKNLLSKYNIPSADYATFFNKDDAVFYIQSVSKYPIVIKADGLAQGKGVVIATTEEEAVKSIIEMMEFKKFKEAGEKIVIEEFLVGRELSYQILVNNDQYYELMPSQDYKRAFYGNKGPNTGGMGNISPPPWVTEEILENVRKNISEKLIKALSKENNQYTGIMFIGLMIDKNNQPKVLEINVRFGDPETQVILPLLESDMLYIMLTIAKKERLPDSFRLEWNHGKTATCVVLASEGYPESYEIGKPIYGIENILDSDNCLCFHAGTKKVDGVLSTAGGRVLSIVGIGATTEESVKNAYDGTNKISFEGKTFRNDIGS
ncbi:MAG: phosphoribosylamine--glycine ligase [Caldisericia bacterium]|nr:phosphoribosylamine--glycine ligase [Caldisericia bacterium]